VVIGYGHLIIGQTGVNIEETKLHVAQVVCQCLEIAC
jgi:hypothetical protein